MVINKERILSNINNVSMVMFTKNFTEITKEEQYEVFSTVIKGYISKNWLVTNKNHRLDKNKQIYYFSLEFFLGKMLYTNIINLELDDMCKEILAELNVDLEELKNYDTEPGLGRGELGSLGSCFLDSMAAIGIPGHGCGIRYDYGLFKQKIVNGNQVELPDNWLKNRFVWETKKSHQTQIVKFYGEVTMQEINGRLTPLYSNYESVLAVPYDVPIVGYHNNIVNNLRLWRAQIPENDFDFNSFNYNSFSKLDEKKREIESISKVLYPDDTTESGQILRFKQQYFLVSAGIKSIIDYNLKKKISPNIFSETFNVQLNNFSTALCIPEFMRILIDEQKMNWNEAWDQTNKVMCYTNHTILSDASEKLDIEIVQKLIPRVYMIIEEINRRFCDMVYEKYKNWDKVMEVAIIKNRTINMTHLATVGSHSINGVSKFHTEILKKQSLKYFFELFPEKFNNKTNGISHRRWLIQANKPLTNLLDDTIGKKWKTDPNLLQNIQEFLNDKNFSDKIHDVKMENKKILADYIYKKTEIELSIDSIFDTSINNLNEYNRHLLNILHIIYLYKEILENENFTMHPRTYIFSFKASSGYYFGKRIIKLIHSIAERVNNNNKINIFMTIIFIPNYNISKAEILTCGSDISEQISTAGTTSNSASNMKLIMNGALTLGSFDCSNIEIQDIVGEENVFLFGLKYSEIKDIKKNSSYNPTTFLNDNPKLKSVVEMLIDGAFGEEFSCIYSHLVDEDKYFVLKDFYSYLEIQGKIDNIYRDKEKWNSMVINNIANSGKFSNDNTIKEYANEIWDMKI